MATDHGNVTVNGGTLAFSGGATNSPANASVITVAAGATLDATGLSGGGLTIASTQTLNCVGQVNGNTSISGTVEALDSIGTFANNGTLTLNGGITYVWDVNNFTGTQGGDPGWSLIECHQRRLSITITATQGSPINLDITSLTTGDVPGSAANFNGRVNASGSWIIATATGGITGFTGPSQFSIVTSGFANAPRAVLKWSVGLSGGNNLVLSYTAASTSLPVHWLMPDEQCRLDRHLHRRFRPTALRPSPLTGRRMATAPVSGGTSASGGAVTITTNSLTSTLSIANVQDADAGGITVNVTDNASDSGSSSATLTVIDPPTGAAITQVGNNVDAVAVRLR